MSFVNVRRALSPQLLYKFHFHENTIFSTLPQIKVINNVVLKNDETKFIDPKQEEALQKSFETVIAGNDSIGLSGRDRQLNKLYSQAYHPFLTRTQLDSYFKQGNGINSNIRNYILKHTRVDKAAVEVLTRIGEKPYLDFGILRSSYFSSLGIVDQYNALLKNANMKLFRGHMSEMYYSQPLSMKNFKKNENILLDYLKKSSQQHAGVGELKNFLVVDNPNQSEFFISMASKLGVNVIVLTESNFASPSSTIDHLFENYKLSKCQRDVTKCHKIYTQLTNMKLISMKSLKELCQFLDILQDPYLRLYNLENKLTSDPSRRMNSFDRRLLEMELSILGDIETKSLRA